MSWQRLDDGWHAHPKVDALNDVCRSRVTAYAARGVWVTVLSWCGRYERGSITERQLCRLVDMDKRTVRSIASALVKVGLWTESEEGFRVHDWDAYQTSSKRRANVDDTSSERRANVERTLGASESPTSQPGNIPPPDPTRPDPTRPITPPPHQGGGGNAFEALGMSPRKIRIPAPDPQLARAWPMFRERWNHWHPERVLPLHCRDELERARAVVGLLGEASGTLEEWIEAFCRQSPEDVEGMNSPYAIFASQPNRLFEQWRKYQRGRSVLPVRERSA